MVESSNPPPDKRVFLTDRSAVETDDKCPMRYWWNRKAEGIGIVPKEEPFALMVGRQTHEDLAMIGEMDDIRPEALAEIVSDVLKPIGEEDKKDIKAMEMLYRRLGWLVGFALYIEPTIRLKYKNVSIESEIVLDRDPLWVAVTPDRVLEHRSSGALEYREYKTTISASNKWINSWSKMIQLHIGLAAVEEELKRPINFAQVMGLMKGYVAYGEQDKLSHPYIWGWFNHEKNTWSTSYETARGKDWIRMPVWEYPGGIVEWVQLCGEEAALKIFPHTPPVFLNRRMLDKWVERRLYRERMINAVQTVCEGNESIRNIHFPMINSQCEPAFGDPCPYRGPCWNAEMNKHPLQNGEFVKRIPHHELEIVGVEG